MGFPQWAAISFSRDLSKSGIKPLSPALQLYSSLLKHLWSLLYRLLYGGFLLVYFLFQLWFFVFSNPLLKSSLCSSILPVSLLISWSLPLNICSLLLPLSKVLFLRFFLIPAFGTYSSVASFYLILCVCLYVLGRWVVSWLWLSW